MLCTMSLLYMGLEDHNMFFDNIYYGIPERIYYSYDILDYTWNFICTILLAVALKRYRCTLTIFQLFNVCRFLKNGKILKRAK